jgi:hypothetical protein
MGLFETSEAVATIMRKWFLGDGSVAERGEQCGWWFRWVQSLASELCGAEERTENNNKRGIQDGRQQAAGSSCKPMADSVLSNVLVVRDTGGGGVAFNVAINRRIK